MSSPQIRQTDRTLLVTRPEPQAGQWVQRLRAAGLSAEALPLIQIGPAPHPEQVQEVFKDLRAGDALMFVSPNAALQFFACLPGAAAWPAGVRALATGPGTVAELMAGGVPAGSIDSPPAAAGQFDSEALWAVVSGQGWVGRRVWLVRGGGGRDWLGTTLAAAGAQVGQVQSYGRQAPTWSAEQAQLARAAVEAPERFVWLLSSADAIDQLHTLGPDARWQQASALASHPRIVERARAFGFGQVTEIAPTVDSVVAGLAG